MNKIQLNSDGLVNLTKIHADLELPEDKSPLYWSTDTALFYHQRGEMKCDEGFWGSEECLIAYMMWVSPELGHAVLNTFKHVLTGDLQKAIDCSIDLDFLLYTRVETLNDAD